MNDHSYILVVDDDQDILEAVAAVLEGAGYRALTAANGAEALLRLQKAAPCVVLLDLMMPIMNAWEFVAAKQRDPALAPIPIVVMTGFRRIANIDELGAAQILEKPIPLETLIATVTRFCYQHLAK
jgi:CheY-like chemotaxis protein